MHDAFIEPKKLYESLKAVSLQIHRAHCTTLLPGRSRFLLSASGKLKADNRQTILGHGLQVICESKFRGVFNDHLCLR
jgi:hypothetical protein